MDNHRLVSIFPKTYWTAPDLFLFMAGLMLIFLLTLISSLEGSPGAQHEMLCSPNACFILHMEPVSFHKAQNQCEHDGGYLMTLRDRNEEEDLRSLLSLIEKKHHDQVLKLWIGLKLHKKDCVLPGRTLKGFKWVSGEKDSQYSNWKQEPVNTCTGERCVKVDYTFSGQDQLKWTPGGCRKEAFYACKFSFQGMCESLTLLGPGKIIYEAIFSKYPLRSELKLLPFGTRARIICGGQELTSSMCLAKDGTYSWTKPGPFCNLETQICEKNNGGCEHECQQEGEAVQCFCREGYELDKDGFSCRMKDLCHPNTCEHRCMMGKTGFSCKCPSGFELSENQRNCSDIDECQSQACEEHSCINTHGSYKCVCKEGYELIDGECVDVNECVRDPCSAELTCINAVGSFMCIKLLETITAASSQETITSAAPSEDSDDRKTHFLESLTRTTVELQHQFPHTDAPLSELVNATDGDQHTNQSSVFGVTTSAQSRMMICVLGSVVPLLALIALTLFIAIFRCSRSKQEVKKKSTADGYCWVSSGLDPRLEKLYESILTDDL
ncbi:hypothetical protein ILYODFUR_019327 [Ilyodon furcidens]|uniref:Complement component C1q receptor n=1 Tax=Ilyodon furcidens TaxID=33524 RepID=A0ABV0V6Y4_9TELE